MLPSHCSALIVPDPVVSRETFDEFRTVLEYPRFTLTKGEIKSIIEEEVLPFFDIVEIAGKVSRACKDPDDDKFIACALSASADFMVSGDKDFCDVAACSMIKIIKGRWRSHDLHGMSSCCAIDAPPLGAWVLH